MPTELTLCFFFFFLSLFPFFFLLSFLSFLFPCFLFCDPSQMVITVVLAFLFFFFPLPLAHSKGLLLQLLPWLDFIVLALNHLCLVWVYLSTTTGLFVCHSPSPDKNDYFVCQSVVAPLPATVWVSFLSLSLIACTQWLQLNFTLLGGVSSQQDTSPKRALTGTSKQVFSSPYHQTMPSYL